MVTDIIIFHRSKIRLSTVCVTGSQSKHHYLWCSIGTSPQNDIQSLAVDGNLPLQLIFQTVVALSCIYYLIVSAAVEMYLRQTVSNVYNRSFSGTQQVPAFPLLYLLWALIVGLLTMS